MTVICPYCKSNALLVDSKVIYGYSYGNIWLCSKCDAYVGVHKNNNKPLGTLANAELRRARKEAHKYFDPLWQAKMKRDNISKSKSRKAAYTWLSNQTGIMFEECHIGMFNVEQCKEVIKICKPYFKGD